MLPVNVSYDPALGVTYVQIQEPDAAVARTVELNDLVMVDLNREGQPLGVEFLVPPSGVGRHLEAVIEAFPSLKALGETEKWLLTQA